MAKINIDLIYNFMVDFKKKDIDQVEQAKIIRYYLNQTGLSERGLAIKLGISKSSLQARLKWGRITNKQIDDLKDKGLTKKEIFRMLNNEKTDINAIRIDKAIQDLNIEIRSLIHNPTYTPNTVILINDLQNNLNRLLMRIERMMK